VPVNLKTFATYLENQKSTTKIWHRTGFTFLLFLKGKTLFCSIFLWLDIQSFDYIFKLGLIFLIVSWINFFNCQLSTRVHGNSNRGVEWRISDALAISGAFVVLWMQQESAGRSRLSSLATHSKYAPPSALTLLSLSLFGCLFCVDNESRSCFVLHPLMVSWCRSAFNVRVVIWIDTLTNVYKFWVPI
jgi:hypothetical protein